MIRTVELEAADGQRLVVEHDPNSEPSTEIDIRNSTDQRMLSTSRAYLRAFAELLIQFVDVLDEEDDE